MGSNNLFKAFISTIIIVFLSFTIWEMHLRNKGLLPYYDDNESLWYLSRTRVYQPHEKATVFIGSSRIKYDLDIPTWKKITGTDAVQLSSVGSNPRPYLENLAADPDFKGKLVIDITEGLFFSTSPGSIRTPVKVLEYYSKVTPAQKFSTGVNTVLEANLVFLDKEFFSLNALLDKNLHLENRPGVYTASDFPIEFRGTTYVRQNIMSDKMITDTALQNKVKNIWATNRKLNTQPPLTDDKLDSLIERVKGEVNQIKARGGEVIFIRTPSSGTYLEFEHKTFPRKQYWDKLLQVTQCEGIYFADYPATAHFECPEFSHLSRPDAIAYTRNLIDILNQNGWFEDNHNP
jgi:hypothetical protein